ncbi:hypothetical protein Enr8_26010 [Blastopirellula retiformator]|uniref:Uncharacterized protein n=1 Tax=Blastopirellula retiformator TaxID=2527970 RepID=A0A5C5V4Z2_9BACT|nr:hypothetical protein Enr8_26010 [Blastopirellula retiformator]
MFWTSVCLVVFGFYLLMCLATVLYWAVLSISGGVRRKPDASLTCRVHKASRPGAREETCQAE